MASSLTGERVRLAPPARDDRDEFLDCVVASAELHHPWVFPPADATAFAAYLRRSASDDHEGFVVRAVDGGRLVGVININNIVWGALRSGHLGYYAFVGGAGRGLMTEALRLLVRHAFGDLQLHRLEANIQPANEASKALAKRAGFRLEGFSPRYLYIAGVWRDHERWAITAEEVPRRPA